MQQVHKYILKATCLHRYFFPDLMLIILESVRPNLEIPPAFSNVTVSVITLPYPTIDVVYLQKYIQPKNFIRNKYFSSHWQTIPR